MNKQRDEEPYAHSQKGELIRLGHEFMSYTCFIMQIKSDVAKATTACRQTICV